MSGSAAVGAAYDARASSGLRTTAPGRLRRDRRDRPSSPPGLTARLRFLGAAAGVLDVGGERFGLVRCHGVLMHLEGPATAVARPGPVWLGVTALAGAARTAAAAAAGTTQRPVRQLTCPDELQSHAQQSSVWLVAGTRPSGAMTAGGIAAAFGVRAALPAGTVAHLAPASLLWVSPVRRLTTVPTPRKGRPDAS
ncbi:hypothetical protein [Streptomyces omiyaensis]|uniref:Uncharacterized protein n=1 Tax=Streptomyces omiyaensis TaxID=68247 RepID=A0ABW7C4N8_9ACTN